MNLRIQNFIKEFVRKYKVENRAVTDWGEPIVAFASADDPLFLKLKAAVDEAHKLPTELLGDAETVISYFIPFGKGVVLSNVGGESCSREWAVAYVETNRLIVELNEQLSRELRKMGFKSMAPPPTGNFIEGKLVSDWSHKHVALVAGLGKFGLHRMLITEEGCCGRLGSLVTNARMEPTGKPSGEFCLYLREGTCGECVKKCGFGALKFDSFDRHRCYEICSSNAKLHSEAGPASACGKCVCAVPCSFRNPITDRGRNRHHSDA